MQISELDCLTYTYVKDLLFPSIPAMLETILLAMFQSLYVIVKCLILCM
jgi:hypothetical protein